MNIYDKIEDIRNKPEHIRVRYVWACVGITMFFVLVIWFISLRSSIAEDQQSLLPANLKDSEVINQFQEQKDSLKNTVEEVKGVMQQGQ